MLNFIFMFYYASYHKRLHIVNSKRQFFTRNFAKSLLRNSYSYGMLTQNVNYLTIMNHKISKGGQDMQKRKKSVFPGGVHPTDGFDKALSMDSAVQPLSLIHI